MSFNDLLKDTAKINSFVSSDEYGHPTYSLGAAFACRFDPQEGKKIVSNSGEDALIDGFVYFPASVTVKETDQIEVGGVMYRILALKLHGDFGSDHHYKTAVRKA